MHLPQAFQWHITLHCSTTLPKPATLCFILGVGSGNKVGIQKTSQLKEEILAEELSLWLVTVNSPILSTCEIKMIVPGPSSLLMLES